MEARLFSRVENSVTILKLVDRLGPISPGDKGILRLILWLSKLVVEVSPQLRRDVNCVAYVLHVLEAHKLLPGEVGHHLHHDEREPSKAKEASRRAAQDGRERRFPSADTHTHKLRPGRRGLECLGELRAAGSKMATYTENKASPREIAICQTRPSSNQVQDATTH